MGIQQGEESAQVGGDFFSSRCFRDWLLCRHKAHQYDAQKRQKRKQNWKWGFGTEEGMIHTAHTAGPSQVLTCQGGRQQMATVRRPWTTKQGITPVEEVNKRADIFFFLLENWF